MNFIQWMGCHILRLQPEKFDLFDNAVEYGDRLYEENFELREEIEQLENKIKWLTQQD